MPRKSRSRIAWFACSALPLILLAIFAVAGPATAPADTEAAAAPFEVEAEASEEGEDEEECVESWGDEDEEAGEAEEECQDEEEGADASSGEDCLLRTARARVVAYPIRNQVRLTLGYTTFAPTRAAVEYGAGQGSRVDTATRRLGRSGVVRLSKHLGEGAMNQLSRSHRFTVTLHFPEVPRNCDRLVTEQLKLQRSSDSRITWSQER
jgi:hypothetical protein